MAPITRIRTRRSTKSKPAAELPHDIPMFRTGIAYDVGRVRQSNEDCLIVHTSLQQGDSVSPYYGLFLVADGMGGHELGERASLLAAQTFAREVVGKFGAQWMGGAAEQTESIQEILESSMVQANQAVMLNLPGSGTTLTAALIFSRQVFLTHVGDSRAYFVGKEIRQITHDHSLVQRLVDQGHISTEEAGRFAQRNVLLRAVGQVEGIETDFLTVPWEYGSRLMLCTDGLWGVLSDSEILRISKNYPSPQDAAVALARQANTMGGPDNISVVIVEMTGEK
ncbi:MAG: serine/threonine-protein phosphatase [Anaerolineales bacterium]|nr:serine/threonine-protein phosphatase [Anaerolineales bacterium]